MDPLIRRVELVGSATGDGKAKSIVAENEEIDDFTRQKRTINLEIRELRNDIKNRDEFAESFAGKSDQAEIAKQSARIRSKINDLKAEAQQIRQSVLAEERQLLFKGKDASGLEPRKKMCELIDAHIDECDRWSKGHSFVHQKDDPSKRELLKGANLGLAGVPPPSNFIPSNANETELEDIDGVAEGLLMLKENEEIVDQQLDTLVSATGSIKNGATKIR